MTPGLRFADWLMENISKASCDRWRIAKGVDDAIRQAIAQERERCARIAETMDYAVTDCGPEEPGKITSGTFVVDNRDKDTPARIAAAIRAEGDKD